MAQKNVVVTGVTSFIGMHLAKTLCQEGYRVFVTTSQTIANYNGIQAERLAYLDACSVEFELLDLCDTRQLHALIQRIRPTVWFHHAGWAQGYQHSNYDVTKGYQVNVEPLSYLYQYLSEVSCEGVILTGTNAEYGELDVPQNEEQPCMPESPYGLVKLMQTLRASQLAEQYGVKTRVARVFIPFGQLDNSQKLIPLVINCLKDNAEVELSSCLQERDFIHIKDLIAGYLALMNDLDRDIIFDVFNLCSGHPTQIKTLLIDIAKEMEKSEKLLKFGAIDMRSGEKLCSYGDNKKAKKILEWQPKALMEGIQCLIHS